MKSLVLMVVILGVSGANAAYDYVIEDGTFLEGLTLNNIETLRMTGGGVDHLTLSDQSQGTIEDTSLLGEGHGGIWMLEQFGYSNLEFSGGGVHHFDIGSYATVKFSGGRVDQIWSSQNAYTHSGWPAPHIEVVCDVDSVFHDIDTNILTGNWLDGSGFEIQLVDVDGYSPVIENMFFTPEPATLLFLGFGGFALRKKRNGTTN